MILMQRNLMYNFNYSEVVLPHLFENIDSAKRYIYSTDVKIVAGRLQLDVVFKTYNYYIKYLLKKEKYFNRFSIINGMFCATFDCTNRNNNYLVYLLELGKRKAQGRENDLGL